MHTHTPDHQFSHPPPSSSWSYWKDAQHEREVVVLFLTQRFGHGISQLKKGLDMESVDEAFHDMVSHIVTIQLEMFCSLMENWIMRYVNCSFVITIQVDGLRYIKPQILHNAINPY